MFNHNHLFNLCLFCCVFFSSEKCSIISTMMFKDPVVYKDYGAPVKPWVNYTVSNTGVKPGNYFYTFAMIEIITNSEALSTSV